MKRCGGGGTAKSGRVDLNTRKRNKTKKPPDAVARFESSRNFPVWKLMQLRKQLKKKKIM